MNCDHLVKTIRAELIRQAGDQASFCSEVLDWHSLDEKGNPASSPDAVTYEGEINLRELAQAILRRITEAAE
jgi:hypothetical protein